MTPSSPSPCPPMPTGPRRARRAWPVVAVVALVPALAVVAGCGSPGGATSATTDTTPAAPLATRLAAHEWVLDTASSSITATDSRATTLRFAADGTVSGVTPCNAYAGTATVRGAATVTISHISQGMRACDARATAAEHAYLTALAGTHAVATPTALRMELTRPGGARLAYAGIDPKAALAGEWTVTSVSRDQAIRGTTPGLHPVVTFDADGSVTVATACGTRSGSWTLAGDALRVSGMADGTPTCPAGSDKALDEAAIATGLAGAAAVAVTPDDLSVLDDQGHILLMATR